MQITHLQGSRVLSARIPLLPPRKGQAIKLLFSGQSKSVPISSAHHKQCMYRSYEVGETAEGPEDTGIAHQHGQADKLLKAVYMMWDEQHVHGSRQRLAQNGACSGQAQAKSLHSGAHDLEQGEGVQILQALARALTAPHIGLGCVGARKQPDRARAQLLHSNTRLGRHLPATQVPDAKTNSGYHDCSSACGQMAHSNITPVLTVRSTAGCKVLVPAAPSFWQSCA